MPGIITAPPRPGKLLRLAATAAKMGVVGFTGVSANE